MGNTSSPMPDEFVEIDIFGEKDTKTSAGNAAKPEGQIRRLYRVLAGDPIEAFVHEGQYLEIVKDILMNIRKKTKKETRISLSDIASIYPNQEDEVLFILKTFDHQLHIRFDNTFQVFLGKEDPLYNKTREISDYKIYLPGKIREKAKGQFLKEIQQYWDITEGMAAALFESTYFKMPMKGGFQKIHTKQSIIGSTVSEEQLNALKQINPSTPKPKTECISAVMDLVHTSECEKDQKPPIIWTAGVKVGQNDQPADTAHENAGAEPVTQKQKGNAYDFDEDQLVACKRERDGNEINLLPDELEKWKTIIAAYESLPMPAKICALYKIFKRNTPEAMKRNHIDTPAVLFWVLQSCFRDDFDFLNK